MATTFVLAGGQKIETEEFDEKLAKLIRQQVGEPRILSCFFGRDESHWAKSSASWNIWLEKHFRGEFSYETARIDTFLEQVSASNVIFLHGGTTSLLEDALKKFTSLKKAFEGKMIIGSSAGANYLSSVYYSPSKNLVGHGSGLVDVASIVHYGADSDGDVSLSKAEWNSVVEKVKEASGKDRPLVLLPEGTYSVFIG